MKKSIFVLLALFMVLSLTKGVRAIEEVSLDYYFSTGAPFDKDIRFDPNIPTPESVLGYQVGQWHVRPEQIAEYMYALASSSDRVWVEEIGKTYEHRPLLLVAFSSPDNIKNLDAIKQQNRQFETRSENAPAVAWMGYSVHGNEPSGANAAVLFAYYLAAAQGTEVESMLSDTVVLVDPMINPDGIARFAHWVNSHRNYVESNDSNDIEHNENWPRGRTNHYWFDLNRDWLLVQHPESRARIKAFHEWKPQVLTDFHEMGSNATYFFQPGVPSRQNPKTPQRNFDLTARIAEFHGVALDDIGSTYYSKENFDDFYYGKGSTYPDINGAIGILFEQASSRGHAQDTINGTLTFPFTIRNQLTASFSTLKAVVAEKSNLLNYQRDFYRMAKEQADDANVKAYVFDADGDTRRLKEFLNILDHHQVKYYQLGRDIRVGGRQYSKDEAYIVPSEQMQHKLVTTIFETETTFKDNTFYDVSSWTLALSFNLDFKALDSGDFSSRMLGKPESRSFNDAVFVLREEAVAIKFDWRNFSTAPLVSQLLREGYRLRVATKPAEFSGLGKNIDVRLGDVVLPLGLQNQQRAEVEARVGELVQKYQVKVEQITSGLAKQGIDLGSPSMRPIVNPKPLLVVGDGVSGYDIGEIWFQLDQRLNIPAVKVTQSQLGRIDLTDYTHIIMASGRYRLNEKTTAAVSDWINQGGQLIANRTAGRWLSEQSFSPIIEKEIEQQDAPKISYAERRDHNAEQIIGGAIFASRLDLTHPLAYGFERDVIPVFRRGTDVWQVKDTKDFVTVSEYLENPLLSGYSSKANQEKIGSTINIAAHRKGRGGVIYYADNLNFRAFWWGTSKLFSNSLFFAHAH